MARSMQNTNKIIQIDTWHDQCEMRKNSPYNWKVGWQAVMLITMFEPGVNKLFFPGRQSFSITQADLVSIGSNISTEQFRERIVKKGRPNHADRSLD